MRKDSGLGEHVSTSRMHDALDGLLDAAQLARIESHLQACAPCRETYAGLSETVRAVRALSPSATPPDGAWEAISARISGSPARAERRGAERPGAERRPAAVVRFPVLASPARRFAFSAPQLAAAALVISVVSAGSVWVAMSRTGSGGPSAGSSAASIESSAPRGVAGLPEGPAARVVSSQGAGYAEAVSRLEEVLVAGRSVLAPETLVSIEQSLRTVDAAIAEIESALVADPGSDMLRRMLVAHRSTRLGVLQRAASAVQAEI